LDGVVIARYAVKFSIAVAHTFSGRHLSSNVILTILSYQPNGFVSDFPSNNKRIMEVEMFQEFIIASLFIFLSCASSVWIARRFVKCCSHRQDFDISGTTPLIWRIRDHYINGVMITGRSGGDNRYALNNKIGKDEQ